MVLFNRSLRTSWCGVCANLLSCVIALFPHAYANADACRTDEIAEKDPALIRPVLRHQSAQEFSRSEQLYAAAKSAQSAGEYEKAERPWRAAVHLAEITWGPDHPVFANRLGDLATNLYHQGKYWLAEPMLRQALRIDRSRLGRSHSATLDLLNNLASNVEEQGKITMAEGLFREAYSAAARKCKPGYATYILNNLAENLLYQGRYSEAEPLFRRVLAMDQADSAGDAASIAIDFSNLAATVDGLGRHGEAEAMFGRALEFDVKSHGQLHPETAIDRQNLAANLDHQGKFAQAEALYREALTVLSSTLGDEHVDTALARVNLAHNLYEQRRFSESIPLLQRALTAQTRQLGAEHPDVALTKRHLAQIAMAAKNMPLALQYARLSLRASLHTRYAAVRTVSETRRAYLNGMASTAAAIVSKAAWSIVQDSSGTDAALLGEAFLAAQSIRISVTAEALGEGSLRHVANRSGATRYAEEWRRLQMMVRRTDERIAQAAQQGSPSDDLRVRLLSRRIREAAALESAATRLKTSFPRFFDLLTMQPVELAQLQARAGQHGLLRSSEALILLSVNNSDVPVQQRRSLIFVVTAESSAWAEVGLDPGEITQIISTLRRHLVDGGATRAPDQPDPGKGYDRQQAYRLYQALFGNPTIKAALSTKQHWILVPQGPFISLPFAALVSRIPAGGAAGDVEPEVLRATSWLGRERTLVVAPSVAAVRLQRKYPARVLRTGNTPFFGIGDPAFTGEPDGDFAVDIDQTKALSSRGYVQDHVANVDQLKRLPRLPGSAAEIRAIAKQLGATRKSYLLQMEATEAAVRIADRTRRLEKARVIVFATHGLLAHELQEDIGEPALALTPPSHAVAVRSSSANDGLLTASEAATFHLNTEWLILSACNTAAGNDERADSLTGLARAFLYAGAGSLLVSHYPVFDDAARFLTTASISIAAKRRIPRSDALREAMLKLMNNRSQDSAGRSYAHPSSWASFLIIDLN